VRREQPAFHPAAEQHVLDAGPSALVAFTRMSAGKDQTILVLFNAGADPIDVDLRSWRHLDVRRDLIGGRRVDAGRYLVDGYDFAWLA
jgi:hypothetical protein